MEHFEIQEVDMSKIVYLIIGTPRALFHTKKIAGFVLFKEPITHPEAQRRIAYSEFFQITYSVATCIWSLMDNYHYEEFGKLPDDFRQRVNVKRKEVELMRLRVHAKVANLVAIRRRIFRAWERRQVEDAIEDCL